MEEHKYIHFDNVADLEEKLNKLKAIRDRNLKETREFLVLTGIPFTEVSNGFGVELGDLQEEKVAEYYKRFESRSRETREEFEELGVVYIPTIDQYLDHRVDLARRKN